MQRILALVLLSLAGLSSLHATDFTQDSLSEVCSNLSNKKAVLIDVREKDESDNGHITGAILLPLSQFEKGLTKKELNTQVPNDKIVYVHCAVGKRAKTAAAMLEKQGYKVRVLKAGYQELVKAGLPKTE